MGALTNWSKMNKQIIKDISGRTIAYVIMKVSGTFVGASAIGLAFWQSAVMAAVAGVMEIAEELSRAYLDDGKIDTSELNAISSRLAEEAEEDQ
jgi:hypothetical protein